MDPLYQQLCSAFYNNQQIKQRGKKDGASSGIGLLEYIRYLFPTKAFADSKECAQMTNIEAYKAIMNTTNLKTYNDLIQKELDAFESKLRQKLNSKFPSCKPDIIYSPEIYAGGQLVDKSARPRKFWRRKPKKKKKTDLERYELPRLSARSLTPSLVNSIAANNTIITSHPGVKAFKEYTANEYKKRGVKTQFVDSFDITRRGHGYLHCISHSIHLCNPKGREK